MQARTIGTIWRTVRERPALLVSVVILGWSIDYTVTLALTHTTGAELYGVLAAALSTIAAAANLVLLRSPRTRVVVTAALVALWTVVALAGIAGTIAHVVGPVAGHGPVDLRPRPITAPLVFTLLGGAGAAALIVGQRSRTFASSKSEKE